MKVILEFMFQGECIESREYTKDTAPLFLPNTNDTIHLYLKNTHWSEEYSNTWLVKDRLFFFFNNGDTYQKVQIHCEPKQTKQDAGFLFA